MEYPIAYLSNTEPQHLAPTENRLEQARSEYELCTSQDFNTLRILSIFSSREKNNSVCY